MPGLDWLPFSILSFGNGQLMAFLPSGEEEMRRVVEFAQTYPEIFRRFFPSVDIDDILAGNYGVVNEDGNSSASHSEPPTDNDEESGDNDEDDDPGDAPANISPLAHASAKELADFRAMAAAINGQTLSFPHLVRTGQCRLHPSYRAAFVARAVRDRTSTYTWDRRRPLPRHPQDLEGAELRSFLASQGLPPYVPPTRLMEFAPRRLSALYRGSPSIQMVKGGAFLKRLTREPTALDLAYSTAGTTVEPELNRVYRFEELYPDTSEEMDENSEPLAWGSSPTRAGDSVWDSPSSSASVWPTSQDTALSFNY
ncbi:hypothetical protein K525DRAFT_273818 [Schizophyllum commune Loenen D]|nr:hypothetical protein K525DRAFT_273818 [Schizophyllum commune Loenen D]